MYDLHQLVRTFGYTSEAEMLEDFYEHLGLSVRGCARIMGHKYNFTLARLQAHGIGMRPRGGWLSAQRARYAKH